MVIDAFLLGLVVVLFRRRRMGLAVIIEFGLLRRVCRAVTLLRLFWTHRDMGSSMFCVLIIVLVDMLMVRVIRRFLMVLYL